MKNVLLVAAGLLTLAASGVVSAQPAPTNDQIIATRQSGMALTGAIADWMKAGVASGADPKQFADAAAAIAKWGDAYPHLFPDGTQSGHDTKAKPEIWSDRAGFEKASADMVAASIKLADAAKSGDKDAFKAAFGAEGQTCGACHRAYKNR